MTRRERMIRVIENFGQDRERRHAERLIQRLGLAVFTDDAIDALAASLVKDWRYHQAMVRRNRAVLAKAEG